MNRPVVWRVGGPQGGGVDTAAKLFAHAVATGGLQLHGRREYYSNIMGRHSYFDVRVHEAPVTSHDATVDVLSTLDVESLARHAGAVRDGGCILYDGGAGSAALDALRFLDAPLRDRLSAACEAQGQAADTDGVLGLAAARDVTLLAAPYGELLAAAAEALGIGERRAERARNSLSVAIACAVLDYPAEYLRRAAEDRFGGSGAAVDLNQAVIDGAYAWVADCDALDDARPVLTPAEPSARRLLCNGNQAVALGKLAAGCSFQTYYPISPATDESTWLEAHATVDQRDGPPAPLAVVQAEDEIAALAMATGAALTGARAATSTSGPGFALMVEALGWAGINEVPVVITLYQRGGPSTGMPTRTEQGDLLFAAHAGHGESPRLVVASGDLEEAFEDAVRVFNWAECYQLPVIHLLDRALANSIQTLEPFDLDSVSIERGTLLDTAPEGGAPFERFAATNDGVSPRAPLGLPGATHWLTGGEHTARGRVTEDPTERETQMEKRSAKLKTAARRIPADAKLRVFGDLDARLTLCTWGATKGAALEAADRLAADGIPLRVIHLRLLWPFPAIELAALLDAAAPLVMAEHNHSGQCAQLLRAQTGRALDHHVRKYNGRPMSGGELAGALRAVAAGTAPEVTVLRNPDE